MAPQVVAWARRRRRRRRADFGRGVAWLLLLVALAAAGTASAAIERCGDMFVPRQGAGEGAAIVAAGPALDPTSGLDSDDVFRARVFVAPGIGTGTEFTRQVRLALGGPLSNWSLASSNPACSRLFPRFRLTTLPRGVTVSPTSSDPLAPLGLSDAASAPRCSFAFAHEMSWHAFLRQSACGFTKTTDQYSRIIYRGKLYVRWTDYDSISSTQPVFPPAEFGYDVGIRMPGLAVGDTRDPAEVEVPKYTTTKTRTIRCRPTERGSVPPLPAGWKPLSWLPSTSGPGQRCISDGGSLCGQNRAVKQARPIVIAGRFFSRGWTLPGSGRIVLLPRRQCGSLFLFLGLDASSTLNSSATFSVWMDGVMRWTGSMRRRNGALRAKVNIVGIRNLTIEARVHGLAFPVLADPLLAWYVFRGP